jgi:hypothetical protein
LGAVAVLCLPQPEQLADREQAGRRGLGFRPRRVADASKQDGASNMRSSISSDSDK